MRKILQIPKYTLLVILFFMLWDIIDDYCTPDDGKGPATKPSDKEGDTKAYRGAVYRTTGDGIGLHSLTYVPYLLRFLLIRGHWWGAHSDQLRRGPGAPY